SDNHDVGRRQSGSTFQRRNELSGTSTAAIGVVVQVAGRGVIDDAIVRIVSGSGTCGRKEPSISGGKCPGASDCGEPGIVEDQLVLGGREARHAIHALVRGAEQEVVDLPRPDQAVVAQAAVQSVVAADGVEVVEAASDQRVVSGTAFQEVVSKHGLKPVRARVADDVIGEIRTGTFREVLDPTEGESAGAAVRKAVGREVDENRALLSLQQNRVGAVAAGDRVGSPAPSHPVEKELVVARTAVHEVISPPAADGVIASAAEDLIVPGIGCHAKGLEEVVLPENIVAGPTDHRVASVAPEELDTGIVRCQTVIERPAEGGFDIGEMHAPRTAGAAPDHGAGAEVHDGGAVLAHDQVIDPDSAVDRIVPIGTGSGGKDEM